MAKNLDCTAGHQFTNICWNGNGNKTGATVSSAKMCWNSWSACGSREMYQCVTSRLRPRRPILLRKWRLADRKRAPHRPSCCPTLTCGERRSAPTTDQADTQWKIVDMSECQKLRRNLKIRKAEHNSIFVKWNWNTGYLHPHWVGLDSASGMTHLWENGQQCKFSSVTFLPCNVCRAAENLPQEHTLRPLQQQPQLQLWLPSIRKLQHKWHFQCTPATQRKNLLANRSSSHLWDFVLVFGFHQHWQQYSDALNILHHLTGHQRLDSKPGELHGVASDREVAGGVHEHVRGERLLRPLRKRVRRQRVHPPRQQRHHGDLQVRSTRYEDTWIHAVWSDTPKVAWCKPTRRICQMKRFSWHQLYETFWPRTKTVKKQNWTTHQLQDLMLLVQVKNLPEFPMRCGDEGAAPDQRGEEHPDQAERMTEGNDAKDNVHTILPNQLWSFSAATKQNLKTTLVGLELNLTFLSVELQKSKSVCQWKWLQTKVFWPELNKIHNQIWVREMHGPWRFCDVSRVQDDACVTGGVCNIIKILGEAGAIVMQEIGEGEPLLALRQRDYLKHSQNINCQQLSARAEDTF